MLDLLSHFAWLASGPRRMHDLAPIVHMSCLSCNLPEEAARPRVLAPMLSSYHLHCIWTTGSPWGAVLLISSLLAHLGHNECCGASAASARVLRRRTERSRPFRCFRHVVSFAITIVDRVVDSPDQAAFCPGIQAEHFRCVPRG